MFMASPPELFCVKTCICVKKESLYGQDRGLKPREQLRKYLGDVVNVVVRTRNWSGHDKRYSLAVRDVYGWSSSFSYVLGIHSIPHHEGRWCGCRPNQHWTCSRKACNVSKLFPKPSPTHRFSTTYGNAHTRFYNATPSL